MSGSYNILLYYDPNQVESKISLEKCQISFYDIEFGY